MNIVIENVMKEKEAFKAYENSVEGVIKWTLVYLKMNKIDVPEGTVKAILRDNLIVDFSFEGLSQDFQQHFLHALKGYRIL